MNVRALSTQILFDPCGVFKLIAHQYQTLNEVIAEALQNALDVDAKQVHIIVDERRRTGAIMDNGEGATDAKITRALASVARSIKGDAKDKYGRFGLGFLSALGKCDEFTFTSCDSREKSYRTWTFKSQDYLERGKSDVPFKERSDLRNQRSSSRPGAQAVWWNSKLELTAIHSDRMLLRFDVKEFVEEHLRRFQVKLQDWNVKVIITHIDSHGKTLHDGPVEVSPFSGEPLPEFVTDYGGVTAKFTLYRAPHTGNMRKGVISFRIEGNPQRILAKEVLAFHGLQSLQAKLEQEVADSFTNGVLEGEILVSGVELHESRKGFNLGDSLTNLQICLETWHMEVGKMLVAKVQNERVDERRQDLGTRAMRALDGLVKSTPVLESLLTGFTRGTVGDGHVDLNVVGQKTSTSLSANRGGTGTERTKDGGGEKPSTEKGESGHEQKGHRPFQVQGPHGSKRKTVASRCNAGVSLVFVQLTLTSMIYEVVQRSDGLEIRVNTINPNFTCCEAREPDFIRYCMNVMAIALAEHAAEKNPALRTFIKQLIPMMTYLITEGERHSGLKYKRKNAS